MSEQVILVDEHDREIGAMEKLAAHEQGLCHRAFSIFVYRVKNSQVETLLQQRNPEKYHSGGLWTNTCCSHPRPNESILDAGKRRLFEEFGFSVELEAIDKFHYVAKFDNGLTENEMDYVLIGKYNNEKINPTPEEISDYQWRSLQEIEMQLKSPEAAEQFTPWFSEAFEMAQKTLRDYR